MSTFMLNGLLVLLKNFYAQENLKIWHILKPETNQMQFLSNTTQSQPHKKLHTLTFLLYIKSQLKSD